MSIVHACIAPHSPVLMPLIGKEHYERLSETTRSLATVNTRLKELKPDTIVVLAPHASAHEKTGLSIHVPEKYSARYEQFGDMATHQDFFPDTVLADQVKDALLTSKIHATYTSDKELEYSAGIPLFHLTKGVTAKLLVIHPGEHTLLKDCKDVGVVLQKCFQESEKRIAIIASGDLSHCLTEGAPGGYIPAAMQFDKDIVGFLKAQRIKQMVKIEPTIIDQFGACGISVYTILLSILDTMTCSPSFLSYEAPLGVGHIVIEYLF